MTLALIVILIVIGLLAGALAIRIIKWILTIAYDIAPYIAIGVGIITLLYFSGAFEKEHIDWAKDKYIGKVIKVFKDKSESNRCRDEQCYDTILPSPTPE